MWKAIANKNQLSKAYKDAAVPVKSSRACDRFHRSWCLCDRFVVLGHNLLVRFLRSRVAQDHALERVGDDLMEGRLDDGVVHLAATHFDELRPGALIASLWRREIRIVVRGSTGNHFAALRSNRLCGRTCHEFHELPSRFLLLRLRVDRKLE